MVALLALAGLYVVKQTTRFGAGLRDDSFTYLSAAENLAAGQGYARATGEGVPKPVTNFPPLFSMAVAGLHLPGLKAYAAARVLNALLFACTIFAAGAGLLAATRLAGISLWGAGMVLLSPVLIEIFSWVQSEPLFLLLCVIFLAWMSTALQQPRKWACLILAAFVAGLASLTRYVGIGLILAGLVALAAQRGLPSALRLRRLAAFAAIALAPLAAFLVRNTLVAGDLTNRPVPYWHPPEAQAWEGALQTALAWWLPVGWVRPIPTEAAWVLGVLLIASLAVGGITATAALRRRGLPVHGSEMAWVTLLVLAANASLLLLTVLFLDRLTPLNNRILSLISLCLILLVALVASLGWQVVDRRGRALIGVLLLLLVVQQANAGRAMLQSLQHAPQGYAAFHYRNSPTLAYIRELPDVPIYSNDLPWLYFWTGKVATYIPSRFDPASLTEAPEQEYQVLLETMRRRLAAGKGVLVVLGTSPATRLPAWQLADLTAGLTLVESFPDGLVYGPGEQ